MQRGGKTLLFYIKRLKCKRIRIHNHNQFINALKGFETTQKTFYMFCFQFTQELFQLLCMYNKLRGYAEYSI